MNLLCPHCQKTLTVAEQYAGQLMKCPLCSNTFTVPALPPASGTAAPSTPAAPTSSTPGTAGPAPAGTPSTSRPYSFAPPEPPTFPPLRDEPVAPRSGATAVPSAVEHPEKVAPPVGYTHTHTFTFKPRSIMWVAPAALLLAFILSFPGWVGMYPSRIGVFTQDAWQAAFGDYSTDKVWEKEVDFAEHQKQYEPGISGLLIVYLLIFLVAMLAALATVAVHLGKGRVNLPAAVKPLWPWRSLVIAGLSLLAFVFLIIQVVTGFPLENKMEDQVKQMVQQLHPKVISPEDHEMVQIEEGRQLGAHVLHRTTSLWMVVILLLVATVGAWAEFLLERRGNQPPPRIDFMR